MIAFKTDQKKPENSLNPDNTTLELLNKIKNSSYNLKISEVNKNYHAANEIIENIIKMITHTIEKEEPSSSNLKLLKTLLSSYITKKKSYDYSLFIDKKVLLIKEKMTEKYLGRRRMTVKEEQNAVNGVTGVNNQDCHNPSNISEFEIVPSSGHSNIIKEIIEISSSLIKYYELLVENKNLPNEKNLKNLKTNQCYESFFIYEYQNTSMNINVHNKIEKYIEEIKNIKLECEKIIDSDNLIDAVKLKALEKQISIIKEEFQKIYPKYQNLKEILLKNKLIKNPK
jgi:hypothetical protein